MPGLSDWFEVFRCGTHVDHSGRKVTITRDDIDAAIASYVPDTAPIVIGHPTLNAPAYGWVQAFRRVGDVVQARASSVVAEFADAVERKLYRNRSLSFGPGLKFRHVGFLGATPPAVKGLKDITFSEMEDCMSIEMDSSAAPQAVEQPATPEHPETGAPQPTASTAPAPELATGEEKKAEDGKAEGAAAVEDRPDPILGELAEAKKNLNDVREQLAQRDADIKRLQERYEASCRKLKNAEFAEFVGSLGLEKVGEGIGAECIELMVTLDATGAGGPEFAEGQENPVLTQFKDFLTKLTRQTQMAGEFATSDRAVTVQTADPVVLARQARAYMDSEATAGRRVSATAAVAHVRKGQ